MSILTLGLAACAGTVVDEATFFIDPARFALWDCKQLEGARAGYKVRVEELAALMRKAETGPAGSVLSEVAYRPDFVTANAYYKSASDAYQRNNCDAELAPRPGAKR